MDRKVTAALTGTVLGPSELVLRVGPARPGVVRRVRPLRDRDLVQAVRAWVNKRFHYLSGSSRFTDGAAETYLARQGVCRDFAHLVITLLRARGVPARSASVYAPGLTPMDFHAVAEVALDGTWEVVDATACVDSELPPDDHRSPLSLG
jgi:transglutaminase-like putative cysteine protease